MQNNKPTISIIVAVYNGEKFIRDTLDSVLYQDYNDWECIVINDCSKDSTPKILAEYAAKDDRFVIITNEQNKRLARSLNVGLDNARGKYIARLDADDICLPDRFSRQVAYLDSHPDIDLTYCKHYTLKENVVSPAGCGRDPRPEYQKAMFLFFCPVLHPGMMARADMMLQYRYNPEHTCSEDMELWTRMLIDGHKIGAGEHFGMLYRIHPGQITSDSNDRQKSEVKLLLQNYMHKTLPDISDQDINQTIDALYFHDLGDFDYIYKVYKNIIKNNKQSKSFNKLALTSVFVEVLMEHKRIYGLTKKQILGLLKFGGFSFVTQFIKRRKLTKRDLALSYQTAQRWGMEYIGNVDNTKIPTFMYSKEIVK